MRVKIPENTRKVLKERALDLALECIRFNCTFEEMIFSIYMQGFGDCYHGNQRNLSLTKTRDSSCKTVLQQYIRNISDARLKHEHFGGAKLVRFPW